MRRITPLPVTALALATLLAAGTAGASQPASEEYRYRWHLGSLLGRVAGLFLPSHGQGVLSVTPGGNGRLLTSELLITSEQSRDGEYWRYGSEIDADTGLAVRAWSAYRWRGEEKSREAEVAGGVRDVVSGIWSIRRDPPEEPRPMEIWSDGRIYPVMVVPRGRATRTIDGRKVATRHFTVKGYDVPGKRRWKGTLELWLAEDDGATPVEIHISRSLADLRLQLQDLP